MARSPLTSPFGPSFRGGRVLSLVLFLACAAPARAGLWVASQEAGARPASQNVVQGSGISSVESIADDYARDLAWVVGSHAADLYSTAWALHRGAREANPFGPDVESRIALKMAGSATTGLTLWKLRRDGHGRTATVIRWLYVAGNAALVVNNVYQGSKR